MVVHGPGPHGWGSRGLLHDDAHRTAVLAVMCLALAVVVGMLASLLVAVPDIARDQDPRCWPY
ncbi:hypothetical protein ACFW95_07160 [Streptomyces sp. NPDC059474]|uniref:hypothetical protein n=1 Tax=unclassified Streptomyces TaxID=2593676 RepID=UPI0033E9299B